MKLRPSALLLPLALSLCASAALAAPKAPPHYATLDHSSETLADKAAAEALWAESLPVARLAKLYPLKKYGFVSEVEGGFDATRTCVVTARAMMLPLSATRAFVFKPVKTATAFESLPNASLEQCRALAKTKLREAVQGIVASLVAN